MNTTRATAEAVEAARKAAGISRLALSDQTGIPRSTLIRRLAGKQSFTVAEVEAIAHALNVEPSTLVKFEEAAA